VIEPMFCRLKDFSPDRHPLRPARSQLPCRASSLPPPSSGGS